MSVSLDPSERNSQVESVIAHTYNTKTSTMIYNFNDDQPVSPFFGYHVRNKAYGYEEPKQNEATKPDRWQSACRIKPLVNSVQTTKPFMSRYVVFNLINYSLFYHKLVTLYIYVHVYELWHNITSETWIG